MYADLTGQRFTRLIAMGATSRRVSGSVVWSCICDCGREKEVTSLCLKTNKVKSCGCLNLESQLRTHTKHGKCYTPTFAAWSDMKRRCYNLKSENFKNYGGRGITVCDRWRFSFENFLTDMGERPEMMKGLRSYFSIDRIDNDGNYEPSNCQWGTREQQDMNKRNRTSWPQFKRDSMGRFTGVA